METNKTSDFLIWEEAMQLISVLISEKQYRTALFVASGCFLGLRVSDLIRLTWTDLGGNSMRIAEKKTKKLREVTISDKYRDVINQCMSLKGDYDLIFINVRQVPFSTQYWNYQLKELKRKNSFITCENFSCHSLRKAFGRRVWEQFNNSSEGLIMLQKIFGHSSPEITLVYLGILRTEIANVYLNL